MEPLDEGGRAAREKLILEELDRLVRMHGGQVTMDPEALGREAPQFTALLTESLGVVNDASVLDAPVGLPDRVELRNGKGLMQMQIKPFLDESKLLLDPQRVRTVGLSAFQGEIEHELGHLVQHRSHPVLNVLGTMQSMLPGSQANKPFELEADRYAETVAMLENLLQEAARRPNAFHEMHTVSFTHPSERQRVGALLEEMYGNAAFGMNGRFSGDGQNGYQFMPNRDADGFPVDEAGRIIANWDREIQPAIEKQRNHDLERLDFWLTTAGEGLSQARIRDFLGHVAETARQMKLQYPPEFGGMGPSTRDSGSSGQSSAPGLTPGQQATLALVEQLDHANPGLKKVLMERFATHSAIPEVGVVTQTGEENHRPESLPLSR